MSPMTSRPILRLAAIGVVLAALGLAGCGRKGPLDPPPSASAAPTAPAATGPMSPMGTSLFGDNTASPASVETQPGTDGQPVPKGQKRSLPLDVLLN